MIKAVLLDLDNTLLHNPDVIFAGEILRSFELHFQKRLGVDGAAEALRHSIRLAEQPGDRYETNCTRMLNSLTGRLDLGLEVASSAVDTFYDTVYDDCARLTAPMLGARRLVQCLLDQGLLVAIATNPIYPAAAVHKRIAWAGLADLVDEFAFVTHSENMHFAKPDPAFYAETIARVGIEPDEALMIGDSERNDMLPAGALGIHCWHVVSRDSLRAVIDQIHRPGWREAYFPRQLAPAMIAPQFRGNIAALYGLLLEVKAHQWLQRPDPDEWSIMQILCHLLSAERNVHLQRLRAILQEDNPFIAAASPPGPHIPPCHHDGHAVMRRFVAARQDTIAMLAQAAPEDWKRPARHSIFGLTNLLEMAHFTAQHDRLHITQLCQTLGKCAD